MPDRKLNVAAYAAGASLAAVTLIYVFGPTFFLDDDAAQSSRSTRKKSVVGLHNPANDCFINSVLQTMAGLPELRLYLIRELHRRRLEEEVYGAVGAEDEHAGDKSRDVNGAEDKGGDANGDGKGGEIKVPEWKLIGLQQGLILSLIHI